MKVNYKPFMIFAIVALLAVALAMLFDQRNQRTAGRDINFSELLAQIDLGRVHDVTIAGSEISGHFADNRSFTTYAPNDPSLVQRLTAKNVAISARPASDGGSWWMTLFLNALPLIAFLGVWIFLARQMQGGAGGRALGFGKSKAKLLTETQGRVTFEDVAGVDEAKEDLQEIVEFLRDPQKF
ncbi:FtsH-like protein, partial [Methylosinus sp. sav-2]|uniref:ATP-dependent metallopeptidase FtsH/Yme1/Tma family protein n=3 Tax=unclassified Methylosinus TaxID=2624500 RepID=UPI0010F06196